MNKNGRTQMRRGTVVSTLGGIAGVLTLSATLLAGTPASASTPAPEAQADTIQLTDDQSAAGQTGVSVREDSGTVVEKPASGIGRDIAPFTPPAADSAAGTSGRVTTQAIGAPTESVGCLRPAKVERYTPSGGTNGELRAQASAAIKLKYIPLLGVTGVIYSGNNSLAHWTGQRPLYPDSITLTDEWDVDYNAISVSISGSPSGSINHGKGRVSWKTTKKGVWRLIHQDNELRIDVTGGIGVVTKVHYNVFGEFEFGSATIRKSAYADHGVSSLFGHPDFWNKC